MTIRSFKRAHARRLERQQRRIATAKRRGALAAGAALTASALFAANAQAATYTVTSNADTVGTCPGTTCTLRTALTDANADTTADTITFSSSLNGETITIGTANDPLPISNAHGLTITGPGSGLLAVSGGDISQVFDVTSPKGIPVSISGLKIENGKTTGDGGAISNDNGGSSADLTLTDDIVTGSTATSDGGGIYNRGQLTLNGTTVSGNQASYGGGIESDTTSSTPKYNVTITNSTITSNTAHSGGGLDDGNFVTISGSQITDNHATTTNAHGYGGGIDESAATALTVTGSTVSGNTASGSTDGRGGGIWAATTYGTVLSGSSISGNTALNGQGGGLNLYGLFTDPGYGAKYNPILVQNSTISSNSATDGAGVNVAVDAAGNPLQIKGSTISGNRGTGNSFGGGVLAEKYVASPFQVADSTISGNTATHGGGVSLGYNGKKTLQTVIDSRRSGSFSFDNSTIASNAATANGGGIYLASYNTGSPNVNKSGTAGISSTIVSGNTAAGASQDLARATGSTSGGFNGAFSLIKQPGSAPLTKQSVITGVDPQLGPLANNGGPTETMLPSGTSPVIDQGHADKALNTDQRGLSRTVDIPWIPKPPGGDGTDIGSVELQQVAGLQGFTHGQLIGGGTPPVLAGKSTPVKCAVRMGTLTSCSIQVKSSNGTVLGSGSATSGPQSALSVVVKPTAAGRNALKGHPLGLNEAITILANTSASGAQTTGGQVHFLAGNSITLKLPDKKLKRQLRQIAKLLAGAKAITCTAYAGKSAGGASGAKSQAKSACLRLKRDGFKGKTKGVGKNDAKRRLVIKFKY